MPHRFTEPTPTSLSRGAAVDLFVADWEIQCCAPPPAVGEPTTWTLGFVPAGREQPDDEQALARVRTWQVVRHGTWTALADGPVIAYWAADGAEVDGTPPEPGHHRLRGTLYGTVHGGIAPDDAPPTTGTVQRVRLASQVLRLDDERTLRPVPGTLELTDVPRSPRRFRWDARLATPGDLARVETGVLLEVTVPV